MHQKCILLSPSYICQAFSCFSKFLQSFIAECIYKISNSFSLQTSSLQMQTNGLTLFIFLAVTYLIIL